MCEGELCHPGNAEADAANPKKFLKADKTARKLIVTAVEKKAAQSSPQFHNST